jgi:NAD(P)-dependent dehydrogenase (short-subunit alcohol dehydrogenase family)
MTASGRALVVGNTDGIGLCLTRRLLTEGWTVDGISRRASPLEPSERYRHTVLDVGAAGYRPALQSALGERQPFDLCVYCAGIGQLLDLDDLAGEAQVMRVNLVGAVETAAVVLPAMIAAGSGHFLGLSSIGDGVSTAAPGYSASKAALSAYLEGIAPALRSRGVSVTNLRLGFVDTKMAKSKLRPFMVGADRAVDVIFRCLRRRPARFTFPKRMAALVWLLAVAGQVRRWFS